MNKLITEVLTKNKNIDMLFIGNKSIDSFIIKLKLLSGIRVDNSGVADLINLSFNLYKNSYDCIFSHENYDSHKLVSLDMVPLLSDKFKDINKYIGLNEYKNCLSFIIDCTCVDLSSKLNYIFKLLSPIVHHPLLIISSDTFEAKLYNMGYFYELNRDNIIKVFSSYNEVHNCTGFYNI